MSATATIFEFDLPCEVDFTHCPQKLLQLLNEISPLSASGFYHQPPARKPLLCRFYLLLFHRNKKSLGGRKRRLSQVVRKRVVDRGLALDGERALIVDELVRVDQQVEHKGGLFRCCPHCLVEQE